MSLRIQVDVSENRGFSPKSSISIGFFIISTIHFGVFPIFWKHPGMSQDFGITPIHSYSFRIGLEPEKSYSIREGSGFLGMQVVDSDTKKSGNQL